MFLVGSKENFLKDDFFLGPQLIFQSERGRGKIGSQITVFYKLIYSYNFLPQGQVECLISLESPEPVDDIQVVQPMTCGEVGLLRGCERDHRLHKLCHSYNLPYKGYYNYHCWLCQNPGSIIQNSS